jgi:hypothetical protein
MRTALSPDRNHGDDMRVEYVLPVHHWCQENPEQRDRMSLQIQCMFESGTASYVNPDRIGLKQESADQNLEMQEATNNACSSALAASSQTYSAATIPANACQTGGGSTGTASSNAGTTTGTGTGTAAAASSSAASSSSGTGAAPTNAAMLGYECAALGLAGMALFGL